MRKFAVMLYPDFSLQEITCLTSALTVWFGETVDFIAAENKEYRSEEGCVSCPPKRQPKQGSRTTTALSCRGQSIRCPRCSTRS